METKVKKYCRVVCKFLGILTVLLLTLAVFAPSSFGASDSGSCGDNLTWSYYNSTLYISGSGKMNDYSSSSSSVPWRSYESSIKTISIGSGVKSIGNWAFYNLSAAEYVTIPSSVTSIGFRAFDGCKALKSITIPEGVTKIDSYAFAGCTSVTELHYNVINEEISTIGEAFNNIGIDESGVTVYFGANVTAIPSKMFYTVSYFDNVTKVIFEGTKVKKIGAWAFSGCTKLKSMTPYNTSVRDGALLIPSSVTSIGFRAFDGCKALKSITIPEGVTKIDSYAFAGCTSVTELHYNVSGEIELTSSLGASYNGVFDDIGSDESGVTVYFGANVTAIPAYMFKSSDSTRYFDNVTKVIFEGTKVKKIGAWAFSGCTKLKSMTPYNMSVKDGALVIPSSVTSIGSRAFYGCKALKSITIPEGVTKIGEEAFAGCTSVTELHYNVSSEEISTIKYVFDDIGIDESGVTVYFGANVTVIPSNMFYKIGHSDNVTKVIFEGTKVKKIGASAFDGCKKLKSAIYPGSSTQWNQISIGNYNDPLINCIIFHTSCNYGSRVTIKAATCTEGGRYRQTCTVCNKVSYGDTSPLGHTCSSWTVTEKPTCTAAGTREGFCNRCQKTVTEKVASSGHRYNTLYASDGSGHWFECSVCKNRKNVSNHVFSNNCDTDCNVCGYVREITHDYDTVWKTDGAKHWHECKVCGSKNTVGSHVFDNACDTDCNVCGYVRQITHEYSVEWKTDGEKHWHECRVCGDRKSVGDHVFDNACDTDCNVCGYVREITHDYDTAWKTDEKNHWHECKVCGDRIDEDAHTFDDETYFCSCGYRKYRFGDANGDKTVDGSDLVLLCRYMANYDYSTGTSTVDIFPGADANGDGVVDGIDLVLLSRYMANYDYGTGTSTVILGR